MGRNATAIEGLRQSQQETRGELEAVKEGCRARHEEMMEIVGELGRRVETETRELGEHLEKHMDEPKEVFKLSKEELVETQGEIGQVRDELDKVKDEQARMEGKGRDITTEFVECIETRCKRQDGLLKEQREKIRSLEADRDQVSPVSLNEVGRLHGVRVCMPSLRGAGILGSLGLIRAPSMIEQNVCGMRAGWHGGVRKTVRTVWVFRRKKNVRGAHRPKRG